MFKSTKLPFGGVQPSPEQAVSSPPQLKNFEQRTPLSFQDLAFSPICLGQNTLFLLLPQTHCRQHANFGDSIQKVEDISNWTSFLNGVCCLWNWNAQWRILWTNLLHPPRPTPLFDLYTFMKYEGGANYIGLFMQLGSPTRGTILRAWPGEVALFTTRSSTWTGLYFQTLLHSIPFKGWKTWKLQHALKSTHCPPKHVNVRNIT